MGKGIISHSGVVESVAESLVSVKIISMSACSACHAKGACNASDMQDKIIEALPGQGHYKVGDRVTITGKESMGYKALFIGYLLPFLLVLTALIIGTAVHLKESIAGLISLAILVPYYTALYLTKDKIKKSFIFEIKQ